MNRNLLVLILAAALLQACSQSGSYVAPYEAKNEKSMAFDLRALGGKYFRPLPDHAFGKNQPDPAKVELGKALYYEARLSLTGNNSCNSCHNLNTFGVDLLPTSPGDAGKNGARNSPTTLNAALHFVQFWDGRAKDVEEQAGGPILNPVEMAMPHQQLVIERLNAIPEYQQLFSKAFPGQEQPVTYTNLQAAIGAFERTLLTPSPFDEFLKGKNTLNTQQMAGMKAFIDAGCTTCHNGVAIGGGMFQKFGKFKPYWEETHCKTVDMGRFEQTKDSFDLYVFKTPSLRNVSHTGPYFHDGSVQNLDQAIAIMGRTQLNLELSQEEISNIKAFLESMTGQVPETAKQVPIFVQTVKKGS